MINVEIDNIITLCHIIDNFKEFQTTLLLTMYSKYRNEFLCQLSDVSKGKIKLEEGMAKKFYSEFKSTIDTINKYSDITKFINGCFYSTGGPSINMHEGYKYILSHKDEKEKILAVLERLKKLGFNKFTLITSEDFNFTYSIHQSFNHNHEFDYVANAQVIDNNSSIVYYQSTNTNYVMRLKVIEGKVVCGERLFLNSLIFDPNSLPESISKETTFDRIWGLDDINKYICDLEEQLKNALSLVKGLDVTKNTDELIEITLNIRDNVAKLETLNEEQNNSSIEEPSSSPDTLEKRKLYSINYN